MEFRDFIEIAEPSNPKARKSKTVLNRGTTTAEEVIQFKFTTQSGNVVRVLFKPEAEDEYDVVFYVNDTLYDDSPENQANGRDAEILSGVLYVMKDKSDRLKANKITFNARSSDKDVRMVRNLDVEIYKKPVFDSIGSLVKLFQTMQPIYHSYKGQNRIDFDRDKWVRICNSILVKVKNNEEIDPLVFKMPIADFKENDLAIKKKINVDQITDALEKYQGAVLSNTAMGWRKTNNRRASVYKKLVDRHMLGWSVVQSGNNFELTRINPL